MRKRIIPHIAQEPPGASGSGEAWVDLAAVAQVEVSSEDPAFPVENAFLSNATGGWKAAGAGRQTIRLLFDMPLRLRLVELLFMEEGAPRTQEFRLRWRSEKDGPAREIVRQQFNFSVPGGTRERETFQVDLDGVSELELEVVPDISHGTALATLASWRVR